MAPKGLIILAVSLMASLSIQAQAPAGGAAGGNSQGSPGDSSTSRDTDGEPTQQELGRPNESLSYLSGRVVLLSGEVPPEPIRIKRVCGTKTTLEGYTDFNGRFGFQVGRDNSLAAVGRKTSLASMDASVGGRTPANVADGLDFDFVIRTNFTREAELSGCALEIDTPGYRSDPILLGRRNTARSDVGTFILTPLGDRRAVAVSATSLAAPSKAKSSFDKAVKELSKGRSSRLDKAIADLEKAVTLYPEYAAAWAALGQARSQAGDTEGAIDALETALQADPLYLRPYNTLAELMIASRDWERTMELADVVLSVNPTDTQMRWFRAVSQFEMKNHDEAISSLTELQADEASEGRYPQSHHILGMIYADRGQFTEAASEYRRFLELSPKAQISNRVRRLLHEWEQLGII